MDLPISLEDITYAENYLAQGDLATATPLLERLVELAEEYIDAECKTEEKRQYFSFDSKFERLAAAWRRIRARWCRSRFPLTACTPTWRLPTFASRIM